MSKKLLVAGVIMTLVAAVFVGVGATTASAQSMSLCQTVDALVAAGVIAPDKVAAAKAAAGCGAAAPAAGSFTRDLTVGSTGADVTALQTMLGVSPATGYFGAITKAAVVAYQTSKGISPTGYVGPLTRAALNYVAPVVVVPTVPGTTPATPSTLEGTDGTISDADNISTYNDEEVGEGKEDVKVLGVTLEASNDGDISLKSVKVSFDSTGNTGSDHLDDYISGVSVWLGSTKVGSADVDDFNESGATSTKTISLSNAVIRADQTAKLYVSVDAVNTFDSGDITNNNDSWTVNVDSIRFVDGSGVTSTDDSTGDINALFVPIEFVTFSAAADTELKVSLASDSPDATVVNVDDSDTTDGVVLLKGKMKLTGTSDAVLDEMPVTFTVTGATDVDAVTGNVTLTIDGEEYSETVSTSADAATIVFDNLNLDISAGDTVEFTVSADIEGTDDGVDDGDTIKAEVTATNLLYMDIENEEGDQLADTSEKTGTALGDEQALYDVGVKVSFVSEEASVSADGASTYNDTGTFTLKFRVEAFDDTVYVSDTASATVSATIPDTTLTGGIRYLLDVGGTATVSAVTQDVTFTKTNGADDSTAGYIELEDGEYTTITMTVARTNTSVYAQGGLMKVLLKGILWNTDDTANFNVYDFDLNDYKTDPAISVN